MRFRRRTGLVSDRAVDCTDFGRKPRLLLWRSRVRTWVELLMEVAVVPWSLVRRGPCPCCCLSVVATLPEWFAAFAAVAYPTRLETRTKEFNMRASL